MTKNKIEDIIANRSLNLFTDEITSKEQLASRIESYSTMEARISEGKFQLGGKVNGRTKNMSHFLKNHKMMMNQTVYYAKDGVAYKSNDPRNIETFEAG